MRFADPQFLLLLLLVPLLAHRQWRGARPALGYSDVAMLRRQATSWATRALAAMPFLRALALAACVVALARPQWGVETTRVFRESIAVLMVVDISSSMAAVDMVVEDQRVNRLDVVKKAFEEFVRGDASALQGRENDMIGLITFARYPDLISPLTADHESLIAALRRVTLVPHAEEDGTAIGEAVGLGVERLRDAAASSRVMILLTDGSNNSGETTPQMAARIAKALGIRIYAIGAGTKGTALMPARERDGRITFRPAQVYIDEFTLGEVAKLTGGKYFRATDAAALDEIYAEIDRLEKTETEVEHYQRYVEMFPFPLGLALFALFMEMVLTTTRLRTIP